MDILGLEAGFQSAIAVLTAFVGVVVGGAFVFQLVRWGLTWAGYIGGDVSPEDMVEDAGGFDDTLERCGVVPLCDRSYVDIPEPFTDFELYGNDDYGDFDDDGIW